MSAVSHAAMLGLYKILVELGRPFDGLKPMGMYDLLGRRIFRSPEFGWFVNDWGSKLFLSPFYHIDRRILAFGTYDRDLHETIEHVVRPGMVCLDIGSNLGEIALHMALRASPGGRVYAFEPVPHIFRRLEEHSRANNLAEVLRPYNMALSNRNGSITLHCADLSADNQGLGSVVTTSADGLDQDIEVPTMTLDAFVAQEGVPKVDFMKIDIQGGEIFLLQGGEATLRAFSPDIIMEVSPEDLRSVSKTSRDLIQMVEDYGYNVYTMKRGKPGSRISARTTGEQFSATNVYCTKQGRSAAQ